MTATTHGGRRPGAGRKPAATGRRDATLSLRIPSDLRQALDDYAAHHDQSLASVIIYLLNKALGSLGRSAPQQQRQQHTEQHRPPGHAPQR
jgi:hypothetical protein